MIRLGVVAAGPAVRIADGTQASVCLELTYLPHTCLTLKRQTGDD